MQYLSFCDWLTWLSILSPGLFHVVTYGRNTFFLRLSNLSLSLYITFSLLVHLLVDIYVVSICELLWIMLQWIWEYIHLFEILILFLLDKNPEVRLLDDTSFFNFLRTLHAVFHSSWSISFSCQWCTSVSISPHLHQHLPLAFLIITILTSVSWYVAVILICIIWSSVISDIQHLFIYLLAIWISSLKKHLFKALTHFLIRLLVFLLLR